MINISREHGIQSTYSFSVATLSSLNINLDLVANDLGTVDLGAHLELETLLRKELVEGLGQFCVHTSADGVQVFNNSDFSTEAGPDRAQLETNDTSTNDYHLLGNFGEFESTGGRDNLLFIEFNTRNRSGFRTSGNDNVLGLQGGLRSVQTGNFNLVGGKEFAGTLDIVDAVFLEQEFDTTGETCDSLKSGLVHVVQVELNVTD